MKFIVSSTDLLTHLQAISKVISSKNALPILDNFLFNMNGSDLTITASDLETTLITSMVVDNSEGKGSIAIEAKRLTDTLKEFPEQPLTFECDLETLSVDIYSENGKFSVVGQSGEDFPVVPSIKTNKSTTLRVPAELLLSGIVKTLYATADDELRPVMNGIFFEFTTDKLTFVASDAHKLVRYRRKDVKAEKDSKFILPKKPASLLKNILSKEEQDVTLQFDEKNAFFTLQNYKLICRLTEGQYPNYESVIPVDNPNILTVNRVDLHNTIKRVAVFSNQASNLIRIKLEPSQLTISAQDLDFSISAYERINGQYEGDEMEIGFKSVFLSEILANINGSEINFTFSDPSKAGVITPTVHEIDDEEILVLIMPMMINS